MISLNEAYQRLIHASEGLTDEMALKVKGGDIPETKKAILEYIAVEKERRVKSVLSEIMKECGYENLA